MPELPEVETVRRGLEKYLLGKVILGGEILLPRVFRGDLSELRERSVVSVGRRGKLLMLELSEEVFLLIHLRMTGQLLLHSKIGGRVLPDKHTRVVLELKGERLYFQDQRTFGYMEVLKKAELERHSFLKLLGKEPLSEEFQLEHWKEMLARNRKRVLKSFLLDQHFIAGIGNIYADEACFRAEILPWRKIESLELEEAEALYKGVREVLSLGLDLGGASAVNYVDVSGGRGDFMGVAMVYRQQGKPCRKCGTVIQKRVVAGRGTHWCASCQR
ncbi:MAG: formamidopyrimidine-DNA glycosylase [Patescibacteria group bacterium]|nr:MAG: formamidopyrimidine-DNA glycosylase [Patescibacteria group bacterium]